MSCYEWEKGKIKIPVSEWSNLKTKIIDNYNMIINKYNKEAEIVYEEIKSKYGLNKKDINYFYLFEEYLFKRIKGEGAEYIVYMFSDIYIKNKKLFKAKKVDLNKISLNKRATEINFGELHIEFDNSSKELFWYIEENNNSVRRALESEFGAYVLYILKNLKWTSKTGGVIIGNDEYNQEPDCIRGGANYISRIYGGIGERRLKESKKRMVI